MGSVVVVVLKPGFQLDPGFREGCEPMTRETLTPQAPVERLADAVVHRLARPTEVELHAVPVRPVIERGRRELGPVVALDDRGQGAASLPRLGQQPRDIGPAEPSGDGQRDALARAPSVDTS